MGSGFFLFLSQVCIYIAIGNIPIGVALTLFFIYPIVTVLASWGMFGDRPTIIRIIAMFVIGWGCTIALPSGDEAKLLVRVVAAVGTSGPALTALLGWIAIGERLQLRQWGGVGLVTLGVVGLSLERMFKAKRRS
ncbi:MAG: hypothetical protein GDA48_24030 [Hormoscilla sp. GM102CHS1]|nr:hypothetical protein [Hormoscilla sp. GM102CHS1]